MTRFELAGVGLMTLCIVPMVMSMAPRSSQAQVDRCSVHSGGADVAVSFSAAAPGGGPGGGPRVLGVVEVAPSADSVAPSVSFHAINTKGAGANDRSAREPTAVAGFACSAGASRPATSSSTCAINGDPPNETVAASILLPAVQKNREASSPSLSERQAASSATQRYEVSLVPRGRPTSGETRVPCSSPEARRGQPSLASWDLAVAKKA